MSTEKKEMTFEQSMDRLETIVRMLESNEQPLDETIKLFEEGLKLVRNCDETLKTFEKQVNDLVAKNGGEDEAV
ncbi:MAG: exodeoxyribonuclease VII small subunit [Erysipelotrichaceae bacterium]|nr:exodeoxyribonuclease VII small subunit [Erysipelotrichaceae bacterium]